MIPQFEIGAQCKSRRAWYSVSVSTATNGSSEEFGPAKPLRIAAIRFLNPAPLMWDFEHEPGKSRLAARYRIAWMMPAACADRLALPFDHADAADIGLIPIAALATMPGLTIVPGCAIGSKHKVRSILLVRRASQPIEEIRTVAADTSSRASLAYAQVLFKLWGNPNAAFVPHAPDLDPMLDAADAAILIGDPALYALEERQNRSERSGEELIYHDLAEEWIAQTGVPWVSAVWAIRDASLAASGRTLAEIAADFNTSRDRGLANIEALVEEWSARMPIPANTIRSYLSSNIFYVLDEECVAGMREFYRLAAETGVLPRFVL
jgi:chorismate dehydratase